MTRLVLSAMFLLSVGLAQTGLPAALRGVGIDQKLNEQVPLDLRFRDETGRAVRLGDYFGKKPVVLTASGLLRLPDALHARTQRPVASAASDSAPCRRAV